MPLLKHPINGRVVDVTPARATTLRARGFVDAAPDEPLSAGAPSAVQPQPPIDTRPNPPEPAKDSRPESLLTEPSIDTRPPNPLGPTSASVAEADGAGLDKGNDEPADDADRPAKSASKADWVAYAKARGVENADDLTKDELIDRVG